MIRNLKILLAAAMALTAFGALGASSTQAADFHCSVEPCKITVNPDGTGKTAHHIFTIKQGVNTFSTTCETIVGEGTASTKTFQEFTIGNIKGSGCSFSGISATLTMNGCEYLMKATGSVSNGSFKIVCPPGKEIEAGAINGCIYKIPPQALLEGINFHDAETGGVKKSELTVEMAVKNIAATVNNGCWGMKEGAVTAEINTGNTIFTSETDNEAGTMANIWWE